MHKTNIATPRSLAILAGAFALTAVGPRLYRDVHNGQLTLGAAKEACAQNGSCSPINNWICGLNGQNYSDKQYVGG